MVKLLSVYSRLYDRCLDFVFGINTSGLVPKDQLRLPENYKPTASRYEPVPFLLLKPVFKVLKTYSPADWSFIDYGSGRGRVLFLAQQLKFKKVIGVELDKELASESEKNLKGSAEIYNASAESHLNIQGPCFHFFFNPFTWDVQEKVIDNILKLAESEPLQILVLVNPPYKDKLLEKGFRERNFVKSRFSNYEAFIMSL